MNYQFLPMNETYAKEIAYEWKYDHDYAFYDMIADEEDLAYFLDPESWDSYFAVLDDQKKLAGYYLYTIKDDVMDIGFGMNPALTGKGLGAEYVTKGIDFGKHHYGYKGNIITLSVATFNQRAINLYKKLGFIEKESFVQETNGGHYNFISMSLLLSKELLL